MRRKNRKKSFIIVLILFISIGFAALTANLGLNSNITFLPQSFNVYFDNLQVNQESSNLDLPTLSNDDQQVSFTTTINEPGDFYEFTFDVVNDGTMDAALDEIVKSGLTETQEQYLDYTARYYGEREIKVDDILHAGYKEKVVVRVEYKYNIDNVPSLGNISFTFGLNYIKRDLQKNYGEETWSIDYSGTSKTFTAKKTGIYKLETWGASGADATEHCPECIGGYGGYSTGTLTLNKNEDIYVTVGGAGHGWDDPSPYKLTASPGYNGGGYGLNYGNAWVYRDLFSGGGATHISKGSTNRGELRNYVDNQAELIMVSGGGGAGSSQINSENNTYKSYTIGGAGGGYIGNSLELLSRSFSCGVEDSTTFYSTGGTQSSCGVSHECDHFFSNTTCGFGYAARSQENVDAHMEGNASWGGGGGLYGGNIGAGGSGYIGNTSLTNKVMYCYNCQESTAEADESNIKTRSTTNHSEEPISYYAKEGNGYARITYLGNYNTNQYTVINYHPNGGQGSMNTQVITANSTLKENKYTREGYTFVGWSTTEKDLPNLVSSITNVTGIVQSSPGEYTFDYNIYPGDNYFRIIYPEALTSSNYYTLLFNLKNFEDNKIVRYGYPTENSNVIRIKNGYNIIHFNTENSTPSNGTFDDKDGEKDLTASGTFYNFFLYKDSEVNYLDKASITYNSNTRTINLYALWAKVES